MPEIKALAKRLKEYRNIRGLTQAEIAEETGISIDEISLIEREGTNPRLSTLKSLAGHMGITVSDLLKVEEWEKQMPAEVYALLYRLGMTADHTGFFHTAYAVSLGIEQPERLLLVTKWLYPEVAKRYKTSWSAVEQNIRRTSSEIWNGHRESLEELAGHVLDRKPRPAQFLSILVQSLLKGRAA